MNPGMLCLLHLPGPGAPESWERLLTQEAAFDLVERVLGINQAPKGHRKVVWVLQRCLRTAQPEGSEGRDLRLLMEASRSGSGPEGAAMQEGACQAQVDVQGACWAWQCGQGKARETVGADRSERKEQGLRGHCFLARSRLCKRRILSKNL